MTSFLSSSLTVGGGGVLIFSTCNCMGTSIQWVLILLIILYSPFHRSKTDVDSSSHQLGHEACSSYSEFCVYNPESAPIDQKCTPTRMYTVVACYNVNCVVSAYSHKHWLSNWGIYYKGITLCQCLYSSPQHNFMWSTTSALLLGAWPTTKRILHNYGVVSVLVSPSSVQR